MYVFLLKCFETKYQRWRSRANIVQQMTKRARTRYFWRILVLEFVDITIKKPKSPIPYDTDEYDADAHMTSESSEIYTLKNERGSLKQRGRITETTDFQMLCDTIIIMCSFGE